ncbi:hypothetical protein Salat_1670600 [Sesamum alatum]|uniref:Uncharacterized protein n=1 Tax=Sesamum alatum TaxID=300844 RepID=A0AAE1Y731_9LAMI|nr:hypothetical protein Salat_1670600 [Sesamum alatum]
MKELVLSLHGSPKFTLCIGVYGYLTSFSGSAQTVDGPSEGRLLFPRFTTPRPCNRVPRQPMVHLRGGFCSAASRRPDHVAALLGESLATCLVFVLFRFPVF